MAAPATAGGDLQHHPPGRCHHRLWHRVTWGGEDKLWGAGESPSCPLGAIPTMDPQGVGGHSPALEAGGRAGVRAQVGVVEGREEQDAGGAFLQGNWAFFLLPQELLGPAPGWGHSMGWGVGHGGVCGAPCPQPWPCRAVGGRVGVPYPGSPVTWQLSTSGWNSVGAGGSAQISALFVSAAPGAQPGLGLSLPPTAVPPFRSSGCPFGLCPLLPPLPRPLCPARPPCSDPWVPLSLHGDCGLPHSPLRPQPTPFGSTQGAPLRP